MTTLYTYRDVEVTDMVMQSVEGAAIEVALRALVAEPWQVWTDNGSRMLAYGPWAVVEFNHVPIKQVTEVRVMRWKVRRLSARMDKYPWGQMWNRLLQGDPEVARNEPPIKTQTTGREVTASITNTFIRSQSQ